MKERVEREAVEIFEVVEVVVGRSDVMVEALEVSEGGRLGVHRQESIWTARG